MVRVALSSILCLLGVLGDDEASLLQSNAGKKRVQSHLQPAQWVEELARSPNDVMTQVLDMQPTELKNLLELFASADSSSLAKEIESHKAALALAFRGSPLAKGSTSDMVSALQQRSGVLEQVISTKKDQFRKKNDGKNSSTFPGSFEIKEDAFTLSGGRCRTGMEFEDIDFETACAFLCEADEFCASHSVEPEGTDNTSELPNLCKRDGQDHDDFATGLGLNEADACQELCQMHDLCSDSEFEEGVCKRFAANMKSYKRSTLRSCGKKCAKKDECVAFEWDNGECELHDNSTNADLSAAEELGDEHACYLRSEAESE